MKSIYSFTILQLLFLNSCHSDKQEREISYTINTLYKKPNVYDQLGADTVLLSKKLSYLVARAKQVEALDRERVRNSEYATDKPLLIEGEIFTSIYEGHTSFKLRKVDIRCNKANAVVIFFNKGYKIEWCDTLLLVNENGWKLDDVKYNNHSGCLQKTLNDFNTSYEH
jgi:hypothetical protein